MWSGATAIAAPVIRQRAIKISDEMKDLAAGVQCDGILRLELDSLVAVGQRLRKGALPDMRLGAFEIEKK